MLKDEMEVREYLIIRIEGVTGIYSNWDNFDTVDLIKMYIFLGLSIEFKEF